MRLRPDQAWCVQGVVKLKDMASGQEEEVPREQVVQAVQQQAGAEQQPQQGVPAAGREPSA